MLFLPFTDGETEAWRSHAALIYGLLSLPWEVLASVLSTVCLPSVDNFIKTCFKTKHR